MIRRLPSHISPHALLLAAVILTVQAAEATQTDWQTKQVDWRLTGGSRIKAISYPPDKPPPTLSRHSRRPPTVRRKEALTSSVTTLGEQASTSVYAYVIDSPPIDGFIPWVAVSITNARSDELDFFGYTEMSVVGDFLTDHPETDYAIGIFDTGAAIHLMGNADAAQAGVFDAGLDGPMTIEISGATGSVDAIVSYPLGIFVDGLDAIEPNSPGDPNGLLDTSAMVGEWNVSIALGQVPEQNAPDLPTVIGTPLSVYLAADVHADQQITVTHNSQEFTGPAITVYEHNDPCLPTYTNNITLELRPGGGAVAYWPFVNPDPYEVYPMIPSAIIGDKFQSLFFFPEVDLAEDGNSAIDRSEFIFDTGASVTVISSTLANSLGLKPGEPDFEVVIIDVTGAVTTKPGFYVDSLSIPSSGQLLSFTNVPVIRLDIASPEGGFLDGVIGMNLFVEYNFIFNGMAMDTHTPPYLEFEPIPYHIVADIAPPGGDGKVDNLDLREFAHAWLAIPTSENWNSKADMVSDAIINFPDFAVLANHWDEQITP